MVDEQLDVGGLKVMVRSHEKRLDKIDIILDKVRNRPPIWITFVFGTLTLVIGWLIRKI